MLADEIIQEQNKKMNSARSRDSDRGFKMSYLFNNNQLTVTQIASKLSIPESTVEGILYGADDISSNLYEEFERLYDESEKTLENTSFEAVHPGWIVVVNHTEFISSTRVVKVQRYSSKAPQNAVNYQSSSTFNDWHGLFSLANPVEFG